MKETRMIDGDTRDRAEIHDLFNRYADAVVNRQWRLLDQVFTEDVTGGRAALVRKIRDVIERATETRFFGNYTATIEGDVAEASVRVRLYQAAGAGAQDRLYEKVLGTFRARLIRTGEGWRIRHFGRVRHARLGAG